jgi:hypothetical protein
MDTRGGLRNSGNIKEVEDSNISDNCEGLPGYGKYLILV